MQIYVIFLFYWKMNADDWGTYKDVQFSVHMAGLLGEFGPVKVSPHLMPLHVLICIDRKTQEKKKELPINYCEPFQENHTQKIHGFAKILMSTYFSIALTLTYTLQIY